MKSVSYFSIRPKWQEVITPGEFWRSSSDIWVLNLLFMCLTLKNHCSCYIVPLCVMTWVRWLWNESGDCLWEGRTYQSLVKTLSTFSLSWTPDPSSLHFAWRLTDNWNWSHKYTKIPIIFTGILKSVFLGIKKSEIFVSNYKGKL